MSILWILFTVCLTIAYLIDWRDRDRYVHDIKCREQFFTVILILILGLFCGLRTWGNDTSTYIGIYTGSLTPALSEFFAQGLPDFADGIGYLFINSLLKTIGISPQNYLLIYAFATIIPYIWFLRRYSESMVFSVFLMFATGFYTFTFAAIKQCMATAICLVAIDAILKNKWGKFFFWVFLASLFHPYSVVYLLVPLMMFKPSTKWTYIYIVIFVGVGFLLEELLGVILDVTDMMGASYDEETFIGEGINIFRVMVAFVPMGLAAIGGKRTFLTSTKKDDLMFNLSMLNALIMFVGLFGTANYFARLANYFLPGQIITLPFLLKRWKPKICEILTYACIIGYLGYFYYENSIVRPFNTSYAFMNFFDYIKSMV